jgi:uncharacterized protein involved in type VI secretion and phage assembly
VSRVATRPADRAGLGDDVRWFGVHVAIVIDVVDPDAQGRVRVRFPWAADGDGPLESWCRLATLMAGASRGTWFVPDVDDEVLVCFENGEPSRPCVIGALWNGVDAPPEQMDGAGDNHVKVIHTRAGVRVRFDDTPGGESLTLETPGGQKVTLDDGATSVTVEDSNGNRVVLDSSAISVNAASQVKVDAGTVKVTAGSVTVDAAMSTFNGVVKADTVIATSVVGTSYTPGAGNVW